MPFLSYTVFADAACTQVRSFHKLHGDDAIRALRSFRNAKGSDLKVGDVIWACRIDRIGSEHPSEMED